MKLSARNLHQEQVKMVQAYVNELKTAFPFNIPSGDEFADYFPEALRIILLEQVLDGTECECSVALDKRQVFPHYLGLLSKYYKDSGDELRECHDAELSSIAQMFPWLVVE